MGGFKEMLVPTPYFDPTVTFTRQVKTNVQEEHICDITYAGVYRKVKNDIIANVTVTWLDKEEELWELRLFQDANGTPELENYQKKATFTEVVTAVPSTGAKSGVKGINGVKKTAMSLSVDSSGAALACMRAALEQVDLGARGGLATLGARLKVPEPIDGLYKAQQFRNKDIERAQARVQNPQKVTLDDVEYLEAYRLYRAQPNVLAQQAGRRAEDEDRHSQYAKRPRAAVEVEAAGRRRGGGGAYAREPCDCDVVEVGADEAAAEERARKRRREMEDRHAREREAERRRAEAERLAEEERNLKMDEAWCEDMDGWYKGDW
jgi:hypothetical protein